MSVCLWTLTGLLQLHPVIAVAAFVLSEVQPSQHLWLLPLEIPRQGEFIIVNYSSSNYFTPMITGFRKKKKKAWTVERPRWCQTACLENRLSFTFYTLLPRPWNPWTHRPRAAGCRGQLVLPFACTPEPEAAVVEQVMGSQPN